MNLSKLLSAVPISVQLQNDPEIQGLSEDSRDVGQNFLFFARKGSKVSGTDYIRDAIQKGAVCVIVEKMSDVPAKRDPTSNVPVIEVPSISEAQARIANVFYSSPSQDLCIIGVTGTNGKTTFTYLLEAIAKQAGLKTGVIGTINYRLPKLNSNETEILPAPNTTPNNPELQKILRWCADRKADLVAMEVSSHALALNRVENVDFDVAVFTNLTQDHLDFHKTMEEYFQAKLKLFISMNPQEKAKVRKEKFCVINADDGYGRQIIRKVPVPVIMYAIDTSADFMAKEIVLSADATEFQLICPAGSVRIRTKLVGRHNVYNLLAAVVTAYRLNIPMQTIVRGLENVEGIPGRLETIVCGQNFTVVVDYAHTEDALRNVLQALRPLTKNRVLTLFGCGGDRDRSKRPLMGETAVRLSDWVIVTSDNPRTEDPAKIALDIESGIRSIGKSNYEVILNREQAIEKILKMAQKDDVVLLAGKGHETYQIFADKTIHFDDREIAQKFLRSV